MDKDGEKHIKHCGNIANRLLEQFIRRLECIGRELSEIFLKVVNNV